MRRSKAIRRKFSKYFFSVWEALFQASKDVVIDNTNVRSDHRRQILERANKFGYQDIQLWILDVPLEICLQRNKERSRQVDESVLVNLFNELNSRGKPKAHEGRLVIVKPGKDDGFNFFFP